MRFEITPPRTVDLLGSDSLMVVVVVPLPPGFALVAWRSAGAVAKLGLIAPGRMVLSRVGSPLMPVL